MIIIIIELLTGTSFSTRAGPCKTTACHTVQ